jgi:hypothetical protein
LADFCGSILDGSIGVVAPSIRYTRPLALAEPSSKLNEKDDIFALGTVLYEMNVGHRLYAEKNDTEVRELLCKHEFPDLSGLAAPLGIVIERCWKDRYNSADEVKSDLGESASLKEGSLSTSASYKPLDHHSTRQALFRYLGFSFGVLLVLTAIRRGERT